MVTFEDYPLTLNMNQVAEILNVSVKVAYSLAKQDGFPAVRIGEKRIIVPRDLLKDWLYSQAS